MSGSGVGGRGVAEQLQAALKSIHAGQLPQADALCREVLAREPRNFNALQLLGHVALQRADYAAAVNWLSAARTVNGASAPLWSNLAVALLALRRPAEALAHCDAAIALNPRLPEALCNRGHALVALMRLEEGLRCYERCLELSADFYDALEGQTQALLRLNRLDEALAGADRALAAAPGPRAWSLRGAVLLKARRAAEALAAFDRALALAPASPEYHNNRGTALRDLKRHPEALQAYETAVRLRPAFAEVWCNVANLSLDAGKYEEAIGRCDEALRIQPGSLEALNIRGTALRVLKRYAEAAVAYERILSVEPFYGQTQSHLLAVRASLCDWTDYGALAESIVTRVDAGVNASAPHAFLWVCGSAASQLRCARRFSADEFPKATPQWRGEPYHHERLRVAYLSADFTDHPVAHLIAGVLERHDRERFETFGVSLYRDPAAGPMQARMQRAFDHFEDCSAATDAQVARWLREREIDIAVDLTGHTRGGRLGVLAHRPAPLQVNYLGFAGTSGADYMDYLIGDHVTIPPGKERWFSEQVVRLPQCFLPNDDTQSVAAATPGRSELGLPEAGFVFCAFNNAYKINPTMFDIWMRLLRETPAGVLWLRGGEPAQRANLLRAASARGVEAERLVFASRMERMAAHLARYRAADLFLDTLPYGAHATARDALWAGLPVLTCSGDSFAGRVASSLLTGLGLPDLITADLDEYAQRALMLAHSPATLAKLRARLADESARMSVFTTDAHRRHLESAYFTMHSLHRGGTAPRAFDVAPTGRPV